MLILGHVENKVLLYQVLAGVAGAARFIIGHEQTLLNRVCYFRFFGEYFVSKGYITFGTYTLLN